MSLPGTLWETAPFISLGAQEYEMTDLTPEMLRAEAAGWRMRQHFATADLLDAAADAWEADLAILEIVRTDRDTLRARLEEAEWLSGGPERGYWKG